MGMWQFALYQAVGDPLHIKVRTVAATMIWAAGEISSERCVAPKLDRAASLY